MSSKVVEMKWGDFSFIPQTREVIVQTGSRVIDTNRAVILETLMVNPLEPIPYEELRKMLIYDVDDTCWILGKRDSYNFSRDLQALRRATDDVSFGKHPENAIYGLWRYFNIWANTNNGVPVPGGLILLNRSREDVRSEFPDLRIS